MSVADDDDLEMLDAGGGLDDNSDIEEAQAKPVISTTGASYKGKGKEKA